MTHSETIKILKSDNIDAKLDILDSLINNEISQELIDPIAGCLTDENKGVRNAAAMLILNSMNPVFPGKIVQNVSSENISIRNLAGEILIKFGSLSIQPLIDYNVYRNDDDQKFIVDVLGLIGSQDAADHIMAVLSASENDNVILACIEALGNIHHQGCVDILFLLYDRSELYKPSLVEALGKIGSRAALEFLMGKYRDEDELTKYSILESLGFLGDIDTFFFLLEEISNISGPLVWPLITSIYLLKEKYNLDIPFDDRMKNLILHTLQEGTPEHKKIALALSDVFDDKDILMTSLKFYGEDTELDDMIQSKVFRNIEYMYDFVVRLINENSGNLRSVLNLFLNTLQFAKGTERESSASMLQVRNVVHSVSLCLNNPDEEIRRASMEILFNLDVDSAVLFVDSMVNDENIWNRERLVEILEGIQSPQSDEAIRKLAEDPDEMVRERAQFVFNGRNLNEVYSNTK